MNDMLKQYLSKKYNLGQNQDPKYAESEQEAGMRIGSGLDKALERAQMDDETDALLTAQEARMTPMPKPTLPEADDLAEPVNTAAAQAPKAGMDAGLDKDDPINPSLSDQLDKTDDRKETLPLSTELDRKYALSPDVSYDKLKETQKQAGILEAIGDADNAIGQLGSHKALYAKKAGYEPGGYSGGDSIKNLAAQKRKEFEERLKYQTDEQARKAKNIGTEKAALELTEQKRKFDTALQDEKELSDPNGFLSTVLRQQAKQMFGEENIPTNITSRQLLKIMPSLADVTKARIDKDLTLQNELKKLDATGEQQAERDAQKFEYDKQLKEMELAKKAAEKGVERTEEQKALGKKTAEGLAETKGLNETVQLLDSLSETKQILGKINPATGKKSPKASDRVSGGVIGLLPAFARRVISTPSSRVESDISGVLALPNLKSIFGGNPTEGERKTLLETLFDDVQDESEILRRVESLEKRMLASAKENDRKKDWIAKYGNLDNYKPGIPEGLSEITKQLAKEFGAKQKSQPSGKEVVKKQYSKKANKTKLIYSDGTEEVLDGQQ